MISSEVGKKYAAALFKSAKKEKIADIVLEDYRSIMKIFKENPPFKGLLEAPQLSEKDKKKLLKDLFEGKISEVLLSFLTLLVDKKRIQYLFDIFPEFEKSVKEDQGIVLAEVTTAIPLDDALSQNLKRKLEIKTQKKIEMVEKVDPGIIGGVTVILGDKVIDQSIKYQLGQLREKISQIKVY
ncbi:MAG: F0F1 ATP synthase subunit delta [Candidatus Zixiibacteriota bacterium]